MNDWHRFREGEIVAKTKTTIFDVADFLRTPEEMAAYLEVCIEEAGNDAAFIASAQEDIARARRKNKASNLPGSKRSGQKT